MKEYKGNDQDERAATLRAYFASAIIGGPLRGKGTSSLLPLGANPRSRFSA
jgi:hypothetical protein